jgi:hypothetical protein
MAVAVWLLTPNIRLLRRDLRVPILVRFLTVPWVQWQALRRVLRIVDFELDFLGLFGSEFELFLVLEDLQLTEQLLSYREVLKSPLGGAFESFCGSHSVDSELIAVLGLQKLRFEAAGAND